MGPPCAPAREPRHALAAALRALAGCEIDPLSETPFAERLVRAVGSDFLARLAAGDLDEALVDKNPDWGIARMRDLAARMRKFADRWCEHGYDLDIDGVVCPGERADVVDYLGRRGWRTDVTSVTELCAPSGFSARPRPEPTTTRRCFAHAITSRRSEAARKGIPQLARSARTPISR